MKAITPKDQIFSWSDKLIVFAPYTVDHSRDIRNEGCLQGWRFRNGENLPAAGSSRRAAFGLARIPGA
jgi:hypothetical protein